MTMHFSHGSAADISSVVCWAFPLPHKAFSYEGIDAISNFLPDDVTVQQGNGKRDVAVFCALQPNDSMEKLYMKVTVN